MSNTVEHRVRNRWLVIVGVGVLVLAALVVWRLSSLTADAQKPRGRFSGAAQPVGVATVGRHDVRVILNQIGTVTPLATVTVQPQLSGLLMQIGFKEGQLVHKGDFLAQIDPRPYQIALQQDEGQLQRDQAALQQAQIDLERYQALQKRDSIAKQTVDDQAWLVKQDEGTVRLDQAMIDMQKLNLVYCHIVSPVDGRVGLRMVDVGNYVQANASTGLVVVTQLQPISVEFTVPEDSIPTVMEQFQGSVRLPAIAFDRANLKQLATGTLGAIDTQVDTTTGTVKMRAMFDNAGNALYPQQFVNVQLLVQVLHDVVVLPQAAVQIGTNGSFVYAVAGDNTVSVRPVTLGARDGGIVEVKTGVNVGDRVVIDGADQLRGGSTVTIRDAAPAAADAATPPGNQDGGKRAHSGPGTHAHRPQSATDQGQQHPPAP
jgi:multidrug efflux system membrane fusion protein